MALKFTKMTGFATTHGQDFEVAMAALLFLRGLNSVLDFQLGTNVAGAGAMDDVVFRFKDSQESDSCWTTVYVQLKHRETSGVARKELKNEGAFSLRKYFQSYLEIEKSMLSAEREPLFCGNFENSVFVIFTNAKAKDSLGDGRSENCQAERFLWTESGSVFDFEGDNDMLTCLAGQSSNVEETTKFLSKFRVFCSQPTVKGLQAAVRDELYSMKDEIILNVDKNKLCGIFLDHAKDWWEHSNDILHRGHDLLLRAVGQISLEASSQKSLAEFELDVQFKDESLIPFKQILASERKVIVIESRDGCFRLSLTKLLQAIGGPTLVLDSQDLLANKEALLVQWRRVDFKSLVICSKDCSSGDAAKCCEVVKDICEIRDASLVRNIIFLTENGRAVGNVISEKFPVFDSATDEPFLFSQLCKESRESILAKEVKFQGSDIIVSQVFTTRITDNVVDQNLDEYLDASSVVEVLSSKGSLSVGPALAPGVDYYVDRSLGKATVVKATLLQDDNLRETITIRVMQCKTSADLARAKWTIGGSRMDSKVNIQHGLFHKAIHFLASLKFFQSIDHTKEEMVNKLTQSALVSDSSDVFTGPEISIALFQCSSVGLRFGQEDAVTALRVRTNKVASKQACFLFVSDKTNERDARTLSDFVQSKHLLSLEDGRLRWVESQGDIELIRQHIDQNQVTRFAPKTAVDVEDRFTLLCAEPGMGKSTLLNRLANKTKEEHPHYVVVLIALNDHTALFFEGKHKDTLGFLSSAIPMSIESPLQKAFLKYALEVSGNVVVLFDGFDEIAPTYVDQSTHLLSNLLNGSKASKIWMTSRNSTKQKLENHVSKFSIKLLKFVEEDQRSFLTNFWAAGSTISKMELEAVIGRLLKSVSQTIRDEQKNFLGIPLQTRMLADVYAEQVTGSAEKFMLPNNLDLLVLLEQFVDKKFKIFLEDRIKISANDTNYSDHYSIQKDRYIATHSKAGLILILGHDEVTDLVGVENVASSEFQNIENGTEKTGFIDDFVNGKPRFVHRVFAEFFVANWISEHFSDNRKFITSKLFTSEFDVIRAILDRILCRNIALHIAVLDEDLEGVRSLLDQDDVPPAAKATDLGGRTALHLAASRGTSQGREENERRGEILELLIGRTKDFHQVDKVFGGSPLQYADVSRSWTAIDKFLHYIKNKEQAFKKTSADVTNNDMLDNIFYLDLDKLLCFCLDKGLTVEHCSEGKSRLILRACENGSLNVISFLIGRKAAINKIEIDESHKSPLQTASTHGNIQIVKLLCESHISTIQDLHHSEARSNVTNNPAIASYIDVGDEDGWTAMHFAALHGHSDVISFLISQGGNPKVRSQGDSTPLHCVAYNKHPNAMRVLLEAVDKEERAVAVNSCDKAGDSVLTSGILGGCVDCVDLLVQAGAELTQTGYSGWTPLMRAAQEGHQNVARVLLNNFKAEREPMSKLDYINMGNEHDCRALHFAALLGHSDIIDLLTSEGGDPRVLTCHHVSPLQMAVEMKHLGAVKALLQAVDEEDRAAVVNSCDKEGKSVLMCAALEGCVECVELIAQAGGKLTHVNEDGWTPLMVAADRGNLEVVGYLLNNFISEREVIKLDYVNAENKDGCTAIHQAAFYGHTEVISLLISQGGDPGKLTRNKSTPLHLAAELRHPSTVRVLLEAVGEEDRGSAVNSCDKEGKSALTCGALGGCVECVELLVEAGGKFTQGNDSRWTPLIAAAQNGHQEVVKCLLSHFNPTREGVSYQDFINMGDKYGLTPIHFAAIKGHTDVIRLLISQGGDPRKLSHINHSPLHSAAESKHLGVVKILLEALDKEDLAAAVNLCQEGGKSVLMCAALGGCVECVELIVQAGGKLTVTTNAGWTPLMATGQNGSWEVCNYLLKSFNAEREGLSKQHYINMVTDGGWTALHRAAFYGHVDVVRLLISQDADPRTNTCHNITPLHSAAKQRNSDTVRILIEAIDEENKTAAVNSCDEDGDSVLMFGAIGGCVECVELLVQAGGKMNNANHAGRTPLMAAAEGGNQDVVNYLLNHFNAEREGLSKVYYINMGNKDGKTALHQAATYGHSGVVSILLSQGADPRSQNRHNTTPLHSAAKQRNSDTVRILIEAIDEENKTAAVNSCDKDGNSVLMFGAIGGCVECVELLVQAGGKMNNANHAGRTPLMAAAEGGNQDVVNYLLNHFNAEREGLSTVYYINMGNKDGKTALHQAATYGYSGVVSILLSQGADLRSQNRHNNTPLHFAAELKHPSTLRILLEAVDDKDQADAVNACDKDGDSVLMCGALGGCLECVELLVQAGGKLTQTNNNLETPLMGAVGRNNLSVVTWLLVGFDVEREEVSKPVYISMTDKDGKTALDLAGAEYREAVEHIFRIHGVD